MIVFSGRALVRAAVSAAASLAFVTAAQAGAIITFGETSLGVNDTGELNFSSELGTVGVARAGVGDAISPGCFCEGWGVALGQSDARFSTFFNRSSGSGGLSSLDGANTFGFTANTATSMVTMADLPVTIRHAFGPSLVADVFQVQVTVTNNGGSALDNLVYRRVMDWDVPPTEFAEYVTHNGVTANLVANGGNVLYASNNGFASSDPLSDAGSIPTAIFGNPSASINTVNTDFNKAGIQDHGSVFDFSFGALASGQSRTFNIFYGSAANEASALGKLATLRPDVYSLGQSSDGSGGGGGGGGEGPPIDLPPSLALTAEETVPAETTALTPGANPADMPTFIFAFGGVGGTALGSSEDAPILPFVPAPGQYSFDAPAPRQWYDPPFATGFTITVEGGDMIEITAPSTFSDMKILLADGTVLEDDFDAGESYTFTAGVRTFKIEFTGARPDMALAAPFPLYMDFEASVTGMTWAAELAPVPESSTLGMMLAGMVAMGYLSRRRKA
jgi:hypothetical protein